jgi:hypothetical protein
MAALGGSTFTDYLTGWGTITLAVVTLITLGATIYFATAERRRAHKERHDRQLAQARLVLTDNPGGQLIGIFGGLYRYEIRFPFANHGDRPVIDIEAEVWTGTDQLDQPSTSRTGTRIVLPGEDHPLLLVINTDKPELGRELALHAWRIRWTDADGQQWFIDQPEQPEPMPFETKPPRPY